ncbi:MAG TPA: SDR family NAD(P)-dependent oxidoreductase [Gaiellaceae bacterium]|jgi:NAD(P)-dependent dehydrogenase (short-subunit alcohol dehydrogenase family)
MRLEGKHAVITGAGTGIGRAIADRLASEGARLTLLARDESRLRDVVAGATTRSLDIRDRDAVFAAFDEPLDVLVANAGIGGENSSGSGDRWDDIVTTNLSGTYWCCRAAEPLLPEGGRVVVISSILARIGVANYTAYCASKAGLLGLVRALAAELAPRQIQVNAVCPGWVNTDMAWDGLSTWPGLTADEAWAIAVQAVPLRRMSEPEEIAGTVAWLASPDALGVTGQAIDHNNGAFMS